MKIERINEWFGLYADKILKKRWWILATFVLVMVLSVVGIRALPISMSPMAAYTTDSVPIMP